MGENMKFELRFKELGTNEDIVTWHTDSIPNVNEHVILKSMEYLVKDVKHFPPGDTVQLIEIYVRNTK
jgi:hypothetical protein